MKLAARRLLAAALVLAAASAPAVAQPRHATTSISTNPIAWPFGIYGVSLTHALSTHVAIRGDVNIFEDGADTADAGYEVGASAPIYFRRVFSGPFLEPGLIARDVDTNTTDRTEVFGPEMLLGWHWTFDSGLNVAMALGAARSLTGSSDDRCYDASDGMQYCYGGSDPDVQPAGYFRAGYAW